MKRTKRKLAVIFGTLAALGLAFYIWHWYHGPGPDPGRRKAGTVSQETINMTFDSHKEGKRPEQGHTVQDEPVSAADPIDWREKWRRPRWVLPFPWLWRRGPFGCPPFVVA